MPTLQEEYFQAYSGYFWQWEEQRSVISIPEGSTIAYTEFVSEAMAFLAPQGIPPFGSLLLALIGTNPRAEESLEDIRKKISSFLIEKEKESTLDDALNFLDTLSSVPDIYKTGQKRLMVLQAIFRDCHYIRSLNDSNTLKTIIGHSAFSQRVATELAFSQKNYYRDFKVLALLDDKFPSTKSIIEAIAKLPSMEKEQLKLEESESPEKTSNELIDELIDNAKSFHTGSLVKRIWSGLNIPVHSTLPSDQPIGGFSDLSNKGDFDRLLLSEFANDDLLFLSRLANNEALYIEREIPPANHKLERIILIDTSLRCWGIPKTVAFATMLAIAHHPKTTIDCKVYAIGKKFNPVYIDSVDHIINGLQITEGELHPAKGLDAFFKEFPSPANREVFVITEPSTLRQGEMIRAMQEHQPLINYVIYTDNAGNIDVYKKQQGSKRHIQHLLLPLEQLWTKQVPKKPEPVTSHEPDKKPDDFPLLVKPPVTAKTVLSRPEGELFQITDERFLLRFFDRHSKTYARGWDVIASRLPIASGEFEIGRVGHDYILLMFNPQTKNIHLLNCRTGYTITVAFRQWRSDSRNFIFIDGCFLYRTFSGMSNWRIYADGRLEEIPDPTSKLFTERKKKLQELVAKGNIAMCVLKNINAVFINEAGNLVLNIHELIMNEHNNSIRFINYSKQVKKIRAVRTQNNQFVFADGSSVEVSRCGLVTLKSSNPEIPPVYVPTLLDDALGAATHSTFAGNNYYYKEPLFEVHLKDAGNNKIALIKAMKTIENQSLVTLKDLVDRGSGLFCSYVTEEKAQQIKKELEANGAGIILAKMPGLPTQQVIAAKDFFTLYIKRFTDQILQHGA